MFSKHFLLLLINTCVCLSELIISPSETEIVINEGDPLVITCTASENIDIFYPKNIQGLTTTSVALITESATETSTLTFERRRTVFGDTGWYGCVEASKNQRKLNLKDIYLTPETYDEIDITWIYVYVKSETNLFISSADQYYIKKAKEAEIIFPCRPTSPEYNVTISFKSSKYSENTNLDMNKFSYDPKVGFTIQNIEMVIEEYICKISEPHDAEFLIHLNTYNLYDYSSLKLDSETLQQMTIGENFSMNCSISSEKDFDPELFHWTVPPKSQFVTNSIRDTTFSETQVYFSELTIESVADDNVGEYKCHFYGNDVVETVKVNLQLHARKHLDVDVRRMGFNIDYDILQAGLGATVSAYPIPTLKWIDPKGVEIRNELHPLYYDVNGEEFTIQLMDSTDRGTHRVILSNSAENKTITFSF